MNCSSGNDDWSGDDWTTAKKTIGNATGTVQPNGIVQIANGEYKDIGNVNITLDKNMTITGESQTGTIINGTNTNRIFNIATGVSVTLQNLTLTNGYAPDGGAIRNEGNLTLTNCTFNQNQADNYGGAILNWNSMVIVTGCTFTGNEANDGGAIHNHNNNKVSVNCTVTVTTFNQNQANHGGAISNRNLRDGSMTCTITKTIFNQNHAYYLGGAINNLNYYGSMTCTITESTFNQNQGNDGGAICNMNVVGIVTSIVITETTFNQNQADNGGAISNTNSGTASGTFTVHFNRFYNNTATTGNAIYNSWGFMNATLNWWGSNVDPATITNFIVNLGGTVDSNPWLVMGINANLPSIYNGQTSTVTTNLLHDSGVLTDPDHPENYYHDPQYGHVPDGIPVTFSLIDGPLGTLGSQTPFVNGTASIIFTANAVGVQHVNATIDDGNITTAINIDPCGHVQISKIADDSTPNYWSLVTFTIRAHNDGPNDVEGLQITDLLPAGLTLDSADTHGFGTYDAGVWNIGTLTNGTTAILTLVVNATSTGTFTNWANVTAQTTHDLQAWSKDSASLTVATASYLPINKEFRNLPWGNVITTAYYNDKIYAIVKVDNQGPDITSSVDVLDLLDGLTWTGNYYVYRTVGSYPNTESAWVLNDPEHPFNGTNWNVGSLSTMIGSERWLAIEVMVNKTGTVSNYAKTVHQSSYPYKGYVNDTAYLTANTAPTVVSVEDVRGNKGDTITLMAGLTDYLGNPLESETVEFWIDNIKVGENTTDNTGTALFNYLISETPGSHTLTAVFSETGLYEESNDTGELYVPSANLYIQITSANNNPTVGEIFTLTYKLGNKGPDDAENVTITIPLPDGFVISKIEGDGTWTINGNTITWTMNNVTVGDPFLYISGWTTEPGSYLFSASIASDTFSLNSMGVNSLSLNAVPPVNAATSNTVGMQKTGAPITGIVLAILMVLGGFISTRKKQ